MYDNVLHLSHHYHHYMNGQNGVITMLLMLLKMYYIPWSFILLLFVSERKWTSRQKALVLGIKILRNVQSYYYACIISMVFCFPPFFCFLFFYCFSIHT